MSRLLEQKESAENLVTKNVHIGGFWLGPSQVVNCMKAEVVAPKFILIAINIYLIPKHPRTDKALVAKKQAIVLG